MILDKNKKDNNYMKELVKCFLSHGKINVVKPVLFAALCLISAVTFSQEGEKLFKQNCASCHALTDKKNGGARFKGNNRKKV